MVGVLASGLALALESGWAWQSAEMQAQGRGPLPVLSHRRRLRRTL